MSYRDWKKQMTKKAADDVYPVRLPDGKVVLRKRPDSGATTATSTTTQSSGSSSGNGTSDNKPNRNSPKFTPAIENVPHLPSPSTVKPHEDLTTATQNQASGEQWYKNQNFLNSAMGAGKPNDPNSYANIKGLEADKARINRIAAEAARRERESQQSSKPTRDQFAVHGWRRAINPLYWFDAVDDAAYEEAMKDWKMPEYGDYFRWLNRKHDDDAYQADMARFNRANKARIDAVKAVENKIREKYADNTIRLDNGKAFRIPTAVDVAPVDKGLVGFDDNGKAQLMPAGSHDITPDSGELTGYGILQHAMALADERMNAIKDLIRVEPGSELWDGVRMEMAKALATGKLPTESMSATPYMNALKTELQRQGLNPSEARLLIERLLTGYQR